MNKAITYIILLNHHGLNDTVECVQSLQKLASNTYKIVIVDNSNGEEDWNGLITFAQEASFDFTSFYEGTSPDYQQQSLVLIKALDNKGFAHGNNLGLRFALRQNDAHHFWILNNDTVVASESLTALVHYHRQHPKTILGSKLVYYDAPEQIQAVGGAFDEKIIYLHAYRRRLSKKHTKKYLSKHKLSDWSFDICKPKFFGRYWLFK